MKLKGVCSLPQKFDQTGLSRLGRQLWQDNVKSGKLLSVCVIDQASSHDGWIHYFLTGHSGLSRAGKIAPSCLLG